MTDADVRIGSAYDCWADAERSARYHGARAAFLGSVHRWSMFLVFLTGSAATANLFSMLIGGSMATGSEAAGSIVLSAIPAALAAAETAFNFSGEARTHVSLRDRFVDLAGRINVAETDNDALIAWNQALYDIYKDEPAKTYFALNAVCHNAVAQAIKAPKERWQIVPGWKAALRHFWAFAPEDFPRRDNVV
jgi:hypothetical protein